MNRRMLVPWILLMLLSAGCMGVEERILDDIQLIGAAGYDYIDDQTFRATAIIPNYLPDKTVENEMYDQEAKLSKEVRNLLNLQSDKPFVTGKISIALYSRELAEHGIVDLLDTLQRDPSIGTRVFLGVTRGSAQELLKKQYGNMDNGVFLSNLIKHNSERGALPKTNLHTFLYAYYSDSIDPWLPLFDKIHDRVEVVGIALFDKGRMVSEIDQDDFFVFKVLQEKKSSHNTYPVEVSKEEYVSVLNIKGKRKLDISKPMTSEPIAIDIDIEATVREHTTDRKMPAEKYSEIEDKMEKDLAKDAEEMIASFQKLGIDPLGIGENVRNRSRKWDAEKWEALYPGIKFIVNVKVNIKESGIME